MDDSRRTGGDGAPGVSARSVTLDEIEGAGDVDGAAGDNPYWEEIPPHPDPSLGCIRRGWCCKTSPGWFGPGEIEGAAALLGHEPGDFAARYLVIDGCEVPEHGWIEVFAPVKLDRFGQPALRPLSRVDELYRWLKGACVFYDGSGCRIYAARPAECRAYDCTHAPEQNLSHEAIARRWAEGPPDGDDSAR